MNTQTHDITKLLGARVRMCDPDMWLNAGMKNKSQTGQNGSPAQHAKHHFPDCSISPAQIQISALTHL